MPAMVQLSLKYQSHQFFCRWTHIPEVLSKGNHGETVIFQSLNHHGGIPAVIRNFPDVEPFSHLEDELLNKAIPFELSHDFQQTIARFLCTVTRFHMGIVRLFIIM